MTPPIVLADVLAVASGDRDVARITSQAWVDILAYVNVFDLTIACEDAQTARIARIYLAAHMAKVTALSRSPVAGPVTGESDGVLRRSYGYVAMSTKSSLGRTGYGQTYLDIVGMSIVGGPMVV